MIWNSLRTSERTTTLAITRDDLSTKLWWWWWPTTTGIFFSWSVMSTSLAYLFWRQARCNQERTQEIDDSRQSVTSVTSKKGEPADADCAQEAGQQRGPRFVSWSRLEKVSFWPISYSLVAPMGMVCASALINCWNKSKDPNISWISWGAGLMAALSLAQSSGKADKQLSPSEKAEENSYFWILIYFALVPVPSATTENRWLFPILVSLHAWQQLGNVMEKDDDAKGTESDTAERSQQTNNKMLEDATLSLHKSMGKVNDQNEVSTSIAPEAREATGENICSMVPSVVPELITTPAKQSKRYMEILVHNVSHTDLVLSLEPPSREQNEKNKALVPSSVNDENDKYCLCRPRFSFFDFYCRAILENLSMNETVINFPRYQRCVEHPRYSIIETPTDVPIPTGMQLDNRGGTCVKADLSQVRVRGRDQAKFSHENDESLSNTDVAVQQSFPVNHVFFPLLATLLPRWEAIIADKRYRWGTVKRVLILVSGVGTPRNWTHSVTGNSTEACASLMEHMVKLIDPDITVVKIHSDTNIFRYDENLAFVEYELMPVINSYRDAHAHGIPYPDEQPKAASITQLENNFDVEWRKSMSVTLSFADGSPARTYAIQAGLRPYRPTFFHLWQLKTFWHESKIVDDDLEVYSFEAMETSPAVDIQNLRDPELQLVVDEMMKFKDEILEALKDGRNDIQKFWLRKSRKPVLAVLLVQNPDGNNEPILYRGTNMEVSLPTGSLCAERNVIGTALASNPNLKREHLKMVAVLAVPPPAEDLLVTTGHGNGASVSSGALASTGDAPIAGLKRVGSTASFGGTTLAGSMTDLNQIGDRKISFGSETDDWTVSGNMSQTLPGVDPSQGLYAENGHRFSHVPNYPKSAKGSENMTAPLRKIDLYSSSSNPKVKSSGNSSAIPSPPGTPRANKKRTFVVVQSSKDLNPLKPCGACNEWLKKIAEVNCYFRVVTFTDANCNGVYCSPCQE